MNAIKLKRMQALHSWVGVLSGLWIFVVCLTGSMALFGDELTTWNTPELRYTLPDNSTVDPQMLFTHFTNDVSQQGDVFNLGVNFPSWQKPYFETFASVMLSDQSEIDITQKWHPQTGQELPEMGQGAVYWLVNFHRDFMLPNHTLGRALVGFAGILMMLLIITGLIIHRTLLVDLFRWHLITKSLKMRWRSTHNTLAVWGTPFHLMIAFTGAFLGIVAILAPIVGITAFKGDQAALMKVVAGEPMEASGITAPMFPLIEAKQKVEAATGQTVRSIKVTNWQDETATYEVYFDTPNLLTMDAHAEVHGVTGEIDHISIQEEMGAAFHVTNAITPLHYATYGGVWLKLLYAFLGLTAAMMVATGLSLWLERRMNGPIGSLPGSLSPRAYRWMASTLVGVVSGLVVASVGLLYVDRLAEFAVDERLYWNGVSFFLLWGAAWCYALLYSNPKQASRQLLGLSGVGLLLMPLFDGFMTGNAFWTLLAHQHWYAGGVNLVAALFGLILLTGLWRLSKQSMFFSK